jgi:hypothetical protein
MPEAQTTKRVVNLSVSVDTETDVDIDLDDLIECLSADDKQYLTLKLVHEPIVTDIARVGERVYYEYVNRQPEISEDLRELIYLSAGRIL